MIDIADLGILAAHYGKGVDIPADFTADVKALGFDIAEVETAEKSALSDAMCLAIGLPIMTGLLMTLLLNGLKTVNGKENF